MSNPFVASTVLPSPPSPPPPPPLPPLPPLPASARPAPRAAVVASLLLCLGVAHGQQATERYIPLGQSPGVSGKTAMMGSVLGYEGEHLIVAAPAYPQPQRVRMTPATRIWLDRSASKQSSLGGSVTDLRPGRRVEVRLGDAARRDSAEWVKVAIVP